MQISRLRLIGFKSFVEPTELRIEPGLTGIVGPNGCGKSNLLEAIRWVMGENSPKSMRGGGMDDVIFAGTETRPARDFAEVALVCDRQGAALPGAIGVQAVSDSDGLEVVRRIERGAGSAYRANGADVRARDVALIFADAATGAHSPALVSQGKVAAIIAAKPQERRQLLEEAAGIAGLHVRRKDAEQKLRATETNLARLADILADMDSRATSLRRQARAAERYSRLSDQIRIAEGRMIFSRWRDAAASADSAREDARAADAAVVAAQEAQALLAAQQAEAMAALARARDAAVAAREAEQRLSSDLARMHTEVATLERRLADLAAEDDRIARDRDSEDAIAREGAAAIDRLEEVIRQAVRVMAQREKERPRLEATVALAADRLRDAEIALAKTRADAANDSAERRIADAALAEATKRLARLDADLARLDQELSMAGETDALVERLAQAQQAVDTAVRGAADADRAVQAADADHAAALENMATLDAGLAEVRASLSALDNEAAALDRSLQASASPDAQVISAIRVATGYETALAAALGDDLTAPLLTDDVGDAPRGWRRAAAAAPDPALPAGLQPLADFVSAPDALARRLAQIAVVDQDSGWPLAVGQRLVTRDGHVRRWDGYMSVGDGSAAAERLVRINRREAIAHQLPPVRAALEQLEARHRAAADDRARAAAELAARRLAASRSEEAVRQARRHADAADAALDRHRATVAHVGERRARVAADQIDAARDQETAASVRAALPDGAIVAQQLEDQESAAAEARRLLAAAREDLVALDRATSQQREVQIEAQADVRGWRARAGEATRRIAVMNDRVVDIARERASIDDKPAALAAAIAGLQARSAGIRDQVETASAAEKRAGAEQEQLDARLDAAREALAAAREARAGAAARADNAESRRIEMGRISGERFSCPPPLLPERVGFVADDVADPARESQGHERLQQDREKIGPVNLVAAQELAELEREQATSMAEADELHLAVNRLRGSIGHLNREGRLRLTEAFVQVDGHFRRLFGTLFGGGQAHLAMVDSDDPLEAGLEIMAQPPGKKLAALTLLSGGEQALTAIALIFALFLTNPAPICVLDEVDAPLDDANVERFCDLLDSMVAETATRYLIVTHNAVTMARMHRLFGVTMVERGVSRLVSVDLGAAEQLLAAE